MPSSRCDDRAYDQARRVRVAHERAALPNPFGMIVDDQLCDVGDVVTLAVLEPVEVSGHHGAGNILTRHADEGPREVRRSRRARLVGQDARVELLWQPLP